MRHGPKTFLAGRLASHVNGGIRGTQYQLKNYNKENSEYSHCRERGRGGGQGS